MLNDLEINQIIQYNMVTSIDYLSKMNCLKKNFEAFLKGSMFYCESKFLYKLLEVNNQSNISNFMSYINLYNINLDFIKCLQYYGGDIHYKGNIFMYYACFKNDIELISFLHKNGVDFITDEYNCILKINKDIIQYIVNNNIMDKELLLLHAMYYRNIHLCKFLIEEYQIDINKIYKVKNPKQNIFNTKGIICSIPSYLNLAIVDNFTDFVRYLLNNGADISNSYEFIPNATYIIRKLFNEKIFG